MSGELRLYATFNIQIDGDRAKVKGWKWMERFFEQPREKLGSPFHYLWHARQNVCVCSRDMPRQV